jgi:hypothetical protein
MIKHVYLGLFLVFLVLSPIYVFRPGLPQPADLIMAVLIAILLTGFIIRLPVHKDLYLAAGLFLGQVCIVNFFWWSQLDNPKISLYTLYYTFDFGALLVTMSLIREFRERFISVWRVALIIAILLEITMLMILPEGKYRAEGTANNANQLGYWALVISACALILKRDERLNLLDLAVLGGAGYVIALSLSKAALLSFGLLLLLGFMCQRPTRPVKAALIAMAFVCMMAALADTSLVDRVLTTGIASKIATRLDNIGGQSDDSLAGRGYDRIWKFPEYTILGAGEGVAQRFAGEGEATLEIHSTFATILFSYGIVGLVFFCGLLAMVFRQAPRRHMLYSLPIWAFGMTHQGLRDTMLWVFLGLVFGQAHYGRTRSPVAARRPASGAGLGGLPGSVVAPAADPGPPGAQPPVAADRRGLRRPARGAAQAVAPPFLNEGAAGSAVGADQPDSQCSTA